MDEEEVYYQIQRMIALKYGVEAAERADESIAAVASDIADDPGLRA